MWLLEHPPRGRFMPRRSSILEAAAARTKSRSCRRTRREGRHNGVWTFMNSNWILKKVSCDFEHQLQSTLLVVVLCLKTAAAGTAKSPRTRREGRHNGARAFMNSDWIFRNTFVTSKICCLICTSTKATTNKLDISKKGLLALSILI